jgi:hypothetical protein
MTASGDLSDPDTSWGQALGCVLSGPVRGALDLPDPDTSWGQALGRVLLGLALGASRGENRSPSC